MRTDPKSFIPFLKDRLSRFDDSGMRYLRDDGIFMRTQEGKAAVEEAIRFLENVEPCSPLEWSRGLILAAQDHCEDAGPKGLFGHTGSDGTSPFDRMDRYGTRRGFAGENIMYGAQSPVEVIVDLFIDDGVSNRGHRVNIFKQDFTQTGIFTCPFKGQLESMNVLTYAGKYSEDLSAERQSTGEQATPVKEEPSSTSG